MEKKSNVQKVIDEYIGKGKVNILSCTKIEKSKWSVRFKQKGKIDEVEFNDLKEAQDFCFEFGGKNNMTIAAPRQLLFINPNEETWSAKALEAWGHNLLSIKTMKCYSQQGTSTHVYLDIPEECGCVYLPGKKTTKMDETVKLTRTIQQADIINGKKIFFEDTYAIDNLVAHLRKELPHHNIPVASFQTQNAETGDLCDFQRKRVGDGSKRIELRLKSINGKNISDWKFMDILGIADGLAETTCERVIGTKPTANDRCATSLGI